MDSPSSVILKDVDGQLIAIGQSHLEKPLSHLREQIALHYNVDKEDLRLVHGLADLLDDTKSLRDLDVHGTVTALVRVAGGKVHGSLSRAGKVRGQTPKVEKTDKKKKPRGRANRREQYKKRFKTTQAEPRRGRR